MGSSRKRKKNAGNWIECFHLEKNSWTKINRRQQVNKRRISIAIFSVNVSDKNLSKKQQLISTHKPNLIKYISKEILSREFKPIALENNQCKNWHTKNKNWTCCIFSLSAFQSKGRNHNLFHLRNIQKDVTVDKSNMGTSLTFGKLQNDNFSREFDFSTKNSEKAGKKQRKHEVLGTRRRIQG